MLPKVKSLFSLADPADEQGIRLVNKSSFSFFQEGDCGFKVSELSRDRKGDDRILKRVEFGVE